MCEEERRSDGEVACRIELMTLVACPTHNQVTPGNAGPRESVVKRSAFSRIEDMVPVPMRDQEGWRIRCHPCQWASRAGVGGDRDDVRSPEERRGQRGFQQNAFKPAAGGLGNEI